jgi:hypothetical protein
MVGENWTGPEDKIAVLGETSRRRKAMAEPRKHYSTALKAKVVLEAIKGQKTAND